MKEYLEPLFTIDYCNDNYDILGSISSPLDEDLHEDPSGEDKDWLL